MSKQHQQDIRYEVITQEDPLSGDIIVPIPKELLDKMGWSEGDTIDWVPAADGKSFVLKKVQ